ncbi:phosphatase PAP2 family protein [uncultured Dokdonia sp.]|uniref:phosphatase PAP2 family protein n=1 Tax=uncultured Dokdonia sp. TaxID=575653 RepID=UPI00260CCDF6|nr:phosphatase PAP2 family protein [uncultured Dokdonia sp.]
MDQILEWDKELFLYLNGLSVGNWDHFWLLVTQIENWIPLYILFFFFFWKKLPRKKALLATLFTFILMGLTLGITRLVKNYVTRIRPNNEPEFNGLVRVLQDNPDFSFFSGHSAVSFAVSIFVILILKQHIKWIWLILIWPILFTLSRIFVGVHYPSDLLIGAIVGIVLAIISRKLLRRIV